MCPSVYVRSLCWQISRVTDLATSSKGYFPPHLQGMRRRFLSLAAVLQFMAPRSPGTCERRAKSPIRRPGTWAIVVDWCTLKPRARSHAAGLPSYASASRAPTGGAALPPAKDKLPLRRTAGPHCLAVPSGHVARPVLSIVLPLSDPGLWLRRERGSRDLLRRCNGLELTSQLMLLHPPRQCLMNCW